MRRLFFALGFLVYSALAHAKEKVNISPEPSWLVTVKADSAKKADLKNVSNGYFVELLDIQVNCIKQTSYTHFIRSIINESGVQNASEISVTFAPSYQKVIFHKVSIIRNGQVISQLSQKDIQVVQEETDVNEFQYSGVKRAFIVLKDVRKNDRIEASYSVVGFNPIFGGKYSDEISFFSYNPITNFFETLIVENSRKLNFTYFNDAPKPVEEVNGGTKIYRWDNASLEMYKSRPGSPSWYSAQPYVTISEFNNWQELATWATGVMSNYRFKLPPALLIKINNWKKAANGNKDEFARLALRYVQDEIRYLGLEVGIHTHKPHDPADVFAHGYGDCKDKSLLLSMILRSDSIQAYVALLSTSKKKEMKNAAASPDQFNHAIVAIERNGTLKFVDPTISMQKGSLENNYVPDYSYALVLREGETGLTAVSMDGKNSNYITETLKVSLLDTSTLEVYSRYTGSKADQVRSSFSDVSENDMKDEYAGYYSPVYEGIKMNGDIGYIDDSVENSIEIREKYSIPTLWSTKEDKKTSFSVYAKAIHLQMSDPPENDAAYPVALSYPCDLQYTMKIEMPDTWSFPRKDVHILTGSYQFDFFSSVSGNKITLNYYYKTFRDHVPQEDLAQYRLDFEKMTKVVQYDLFYSNVSASGHGTMYWPAMWVALVVGFLMSLLLVKLNSLTTDVDYDRNTGWPIGGWMVVLGISLGCGIAVNFYTLFVKNLFEGSTWQYLIDMGRGMQITLYAELFVQVVVFSSSVAIFIWFIKRRDIFPGMFIYYASAMVAIQLLLWMLYYFINLPPEFQYLKRDALANTFRTLIYAAIWIAYVTRAYRTKATFLKSR